MRRATLYGLGLVGLATLAGLAALWLTIARPDRAGPTAGTLVAAEAVGGPFSLIDTAGRRVSDADFRGRHLLVYFGYTTCPDVCPTELAGMAAAIDLLGPIGSAVTPVFITIDPERDDPARLELYVPSFHPRLVGLSGTLAEIAAAARAYKVYYRKAGDGADYLMDHSSYVYFVGPEGRSLAIFRPAVAPAELAATMRRALGK